MATAVVVAILALAGFAQGLTGFGFGLVSMALLPLFIDFKDAVPLVAVLNLLVCAATLLTARRHLDWRRVAPLAAASALGVPFGVWALVRWDARWLLAVLGAWMIAFAISELALARWWRPRFPEWSAWPVGFISGVLGVISLARLVELLTVNPARVIRVAGGTLTEGAAADLTLIAPDLAVTVQAAAMRSKSKNTPFDGWQLRGGVAATIVGGRPVYVNPAAGVSL